MSPARRNRTHLTAYVIVSALVALTCIAHLSLVPRMGKRVLAYGMARTGQGRGLPWYRHNAQVCPSVVRGASDPGLPESLRHCDANCQGPLASVASKQAGTRAGGAGPDSRDGGGPRRPLAVQSQCAGP